MTRLFHCDQRSNEWFDLHVGRVTASGVGDVMSFRKTGDKGSTADRKNYMAKKIAETLTGRMDMNGYFSPSMQWGIDNEDEARRAYEIARGTMCDRIGFGIHPAIERFGSSPDALAGDYGMVEIKCPDTSTHIKWLMAGVVPDEHKPQMVSGLSVFERAWCDFVSYDPRLPKRYRLFIAPRLYGEDSEIKTVETHVQQFLGEMDALIQRMQELMPLVEEDLVPAMQTETPEWGVTDEDIRAVEPNWAT